MGVPSWLNALDIAMRIARVDRRQNSSRKHRSRSPVRCHSSSVINWPFCSKNSVIRKPFDVPLHYQGLVDQVACGKGILDEVIGIAGVDPRPAPQAFAVLFARRRGLLDQFASHEVERVPAVPRKRSEVRGVARQHGGIPPRRRESATLPEPIGTPSHEPGRPIARSNRSELQDSGHVSDDCV